MTGKLKTVAALSDGAAEPGGRATSNMTEAVRDWLVTKLAGVLNLPPQAIDASEPLTSYGLGSIEAITLVGELEDWLGWTLPATLLWDYSNLEAVCQYIIRHHQVANGSAGNRPAILAAGQPVSGETRGMAADRFAHGAFEAFARDLSDLTAASDRGHTVSYGELNARADELAMQLKQRGLTTETVVPVLMDRGLDLLVTMLALFKVGGVYVPIDSRYPPHRIFQMIRQSRSNLVLATRPSGASLDESLKEFDSAELPEVVFIDALETLADCEPAGPAESLGDLRDLAYIIYTSGSTGAPKGSLIEHRGMSNHLSAKVSSLGMTQGDRLAQNASQSFDISVWQMLAPLTCGASLRFIDSGINRDPAKLLSFIESEQISILEIVPSQLRALLKELRRPGDSAPALPSLRWLVVTGEAFPADLCRDWLDLYPHIPLVNAYGPTECSDDVTQFFAYEPPIPRLFQVPIGKALQGSHIYALGEDLDQALPGSEGEIYVGGVGVGRGYLHDPAQTAQVFLPNPFSLNPGERFYKTGDLGLFLPDGNWQFLGRIDNQVKVRGFRLELDEIRAAIASHDMVHDVVVVAREDTPGAKRLIAYVVYDSAPGGGNPDLRHFLERKLPDYMIPAAFVALDSIPVTTNGKVDLKALPAPASINLTGAARTVHYGNPMEKALAEIWMWALQIEEVGVEENFFEIGGDSLLALQLLAQIRSQFDVKIDLQRFFDNPTIARLALMLEESASETAPLRPQDMNGYERQA